MRGFSDEERDRIRAELLETGSELFAQFGLERTRIKDVTDEVGIGTSTFYQFFDSKEELYSQVLVNEQASLEETITETVEQSDDPREQVRLTLETMLDAIESNPLIRRLIVEGELRSLQQHLSETERQTLTEAMYTESLSYVDEWTEHPSFRATDPELVYGLLRALVFVTRSKDIFEEAETVAEYDDVRAVLIDVVVDGLFPDD